MSACELYGYRREKRNFLVLFFHFSTYFTLVTLDQSISFVAPTPSPFFFPFPLFLVSQMTLFFHKTEVKKKKEIKTKEFTYPTLSSLIHKTTPMEEAPMDTLEPEEIDENFFYKHIVTHFHSLFCDSAIICIPHSRSIEGLVLTKDIIGKQEFKHWVKFIHA